MTEKIAINIDTTRHAAEETRAIAADLRRLADDTVTEMLAAVKADFSQGSQDGGVSPLFVEPLATVEAALERWRAGHYAYADNLDRAAAGLDATANGAEAAETDAVAAAGRVEPGTATSPDRGPDYTHLVESAVREPDRGPDLTHLVEHSVREPDRGPDLTQQVESRVWEDADPDHTAEAEGAVRGPLKPGDDTAHEWENPEALAAHARRGVDTSEAGSRVGPTIDGNGERVEPSRRAVSWTEDAFAVPLHTN
ncbi:hypothetical protein HMPREF3053_09880 [Corynebacterium sp. HMSC064E07]|uniref:hypothetical protein n=1 Tax=Corynebacterium sp. HMSC064E07 TaxID=1739545 RepID=UPI0008A3FE82|nr:hypothetical protein [Corynebacterium sp. HMSC064E07]OFO26448.1 hypothetical protein HMPREF3053_09880 [Corynebacterium sp. HMSC064E07]